MASRLRIATWNIHNAMLEPRAGQALDGRSYVAECVKAINADIVCLQEVPMAADAPDEFVKGIADEADYRHAESLHLHPPRLRDGGSGLAILSRMPIEILGSVRFPNPHFVLQRDGVAIASHDKGALAIKVRCGDSEVAVLCLHLLPFHLFGVSPLSDLLEPARLALKALLSKAGAMPAAVCGDFNIDCVNDFFPHFTEEFGLYDLIHRATHRQGGRPDHILVTAHFGDPSARIVESLADHHLCVADLDVLDAAQGRALQDRIRPTAADDSPVNILHLSDLHFGAGEAEFADAKVELDHARKYTARRALTAIIEEGLPCRPDFVVVSGDITSRSQPDGWRIFQQTADPLIRSGKLPPPDRWVIVPGNHDVKQTLSSAPMSPEAQRWRPFGEVLGGLFPRPWIAALDSDADNMLRHAQLSMDKRDDLWGGILNMVDPVTLRSSDTVLPFIFDRKRRVLIYAFNSACVSGTVVKVGDERLKEINALRELPSTRRNPGLQMLLAEFDRLRQVDAARIDPDELELFRRMMSCIERRERDGMNGLDGVLKIAVLHHHVAPMYPEEMKPFEPLSNAALFKSALVEKTFQLVLHGHKHLAEAFFDTAIPGGGALYVVSGGTIGGVPAPARRPGFFWLTWNRSRATLGARFVEVRADRSADTAFRQSEMEEFSLNELLPRQRRLAPAQQRFDVRAAFRQAEAALESMVRVRPTRAGTGRGRKLIGWAYRLTEANISTIATAHGLRILAMTGAERQGLRQLIPGIVDTLLSVQIKGAEPGWCGSSEGPRTQPEATCWVLDALASHSALPHDAAAMLESMLQRADDKVTLRTTLSVSLIIRTLCRIAPQSPWIAKLTALLIDGAARDGGGRILWWGRSVTSYRRYPPQGDVLDSAIMTPSAVHTAHALLALGAAGKILGAAQLPEAGASRQWLLKHAWTNMEELIQRPTNPAGYAQLVVNHFALPWAILALLQEPGREYETRIGAATCTLCGLRQPDGLWNWNDISRPIWATHDALLALREAALAGIPLFEEERNEDGA